MRCSELRTHSPSLILFSVGAGHPPPMISSMDAGTLLVILKYTGLFIATASSIWGTTHTLTVSEPDGRKQLTGAGLIAILMTIAGLMISIISEDLSRRKAAADQSTRVTAEARRTNQIIMSAQPLTSLSFAIEFDTSNSDFIKKMQLAHQSIDENAEDVQGGVPPVPYDAMEYQAHIIPLLHFLRNLAESDVNAHANRSDEEGSGADHGIIALLALDESPNKVLSFGEINGDVTWRLRGEGRKLSTGFAPFDRANARPSNSAPVLQTTARPNGLRCSLTWDLDPLTLENALDHQNVSVRSTARVPRVLKLAILSQFDELPFASGDFGSSAAVNLWSDALNTKGHGIPSEISGMTMIIRVNGFRELAYVYKLRKTNSVTLIDEFGDYFELNCKRFDFELQSN